MATAMHSGPTGGIVASAGLVLEDLQLQPAGTVVSGGLH